MATSQKSERLPLVEMVSTMVIAMIISVLVMALPPRAPELAQALLIVTLSALAVRYAVRA